MVSHTNSECFSKPHGGLPVRPPQAVERLERNVAEEIVATCLRDEAQRVCTGQRGGKKHGRSAIRDKD